MPVIAATAQVIPPQARWMIRRSDHGAQPSSQAPHAPTVTNGSPPPRARSETRQAHACRCEHTEQCPRAAASHPGMTGWTRPGARGDYVADQAPPENAQTSAAENAAPTFPDKIRVHALAKLLGLTSKQ